jgi:hypothetical protein
MTTNLSPDYAKWGFTALGNLDAPPADTTGTAGSTGTAGTGGTGGTGGTAGSSGTSTFTAGTGYRIAPAATSGGVSLDLSGGNMTNGTSIQFYTTTTGNNNQRMQIIANGSYNKIVMMNNTNKCFDTGTSNGSWIVINDCNGSAGQNWTMTYDGAGAFQVKNAASGRCLDVTGGNTSNGSHPQIYDCGSTNQKWIIWAAQ